MTLSTLYPDWTGPAVMLPEWVQRNGLTKYKPLISRVYASAPHWMQADADGIPQIAPILVKFNKSPAEIRAFVGGETWKAIHHAKLKTNINRLVLTMIGGWTLDEAMLFPVKERTRARSLLLVGSKSAQLLACRLSERDGDLSQFLMMATDIIRMGGTIDQTWGRKRLKREHDALAMKKMLEQSDPTPWAKAWFGDVGEYSFSLLKSETELAIEGVTQRHCCRSYARDCRAGKEFVFRIEGPERATCSWRKGAPGIQVKGFANSNVSQACHNAAARARAMFAEQSKKRGAA